MTTICFHGIGEPARPLEPGEDRYWIDAARYHAILDESVGRPDVAITFDDGNASDLRIGVPALLERGLTATFFVLAGRLGSAGSLDATALHELRSAGMGVGSHGMEHRPWVGLGPAALELELVDARRRLEDVLGDAVDVAAAPLGRYDRRVLAGLRRAGYRTVYTSDRRRGTAGRWLQPRFSVRCSDTAATMRHEVLGNRPLGRELALAAKGSLKRWR